MGARPWYDRAMLPQSLTILMSHEAHNQETSLTLLTTTGAIAALAPLHDAYQVMSDVVAASGRLGDERITLTLLLVLRCRYTLDKGVLEILRLHGSDAYHTLRRAIETAGSADLVRRKSQLAKVWLASGNNDTAYQQYRNAFQTDQRLPKTDPLTRELHSWYDRASKLAHDSIFGFAGRLRIDRGPQKIMIGFGYADGSPDQDQAKTAGEVLAHVRNHLQVHFLVLQVLARALDVALQHDRVKWGAALATASTALNNLRTLIAAGRRVAPAVGSTGV